MLFFLFFYIEVLFFFFMLYFLKIKLLLDLSTSDIWFFLLFHLVEFISCFIVIFQVFRAASVLSLSALSIPLRFNSLLLSLSRKHIFINWLCILVHQTFRKLFNLPKSLLFPVIVIHRRWDNFWTSLLIVLERTFIKRGRFLESLTLFLK